MTKIIFKTAALYMFFSVINQAIGLFIQLILMQGVSINNYGIYAINFEAMALMQLVLANAYRNFYLQKIRNNISEFEINNLITYQIVNGTISILIFGTLISLAYKLSLAVSAFLIISNVLSSLLLPLQANWLANNERFKIIIKDFTISIVSLIAVIISVKMMKFSVNQITITQFIVYGGVSFVILFIFKDKLKSKAVFSKNIFSCFHFDKTLYVFILIFTINALHNKYGGLFLRHYSNEMQTALYLAAFKFINPLFFIQTSLISAFMPNFIKNKNFEFDIKVYFTFAIPGILIALLLYFFFPFILGVLRIEKYLPAYEIIKVASLFVFIVFIYGAMSNYISVSGGQSFILKVNILALTLMCIASFLLINDNNISFMLINVFVFAEALICILYYAYLSKIKVKTSVLFLISPLLCMLIIIVSFLQHYA
ncbi:hypothetical protein H5S42_12935 [Escherichia coli]|nr:hypothetical protein [Escherichia coli]